MAARLIGGAACATGSAATCYVASLLAPRLSRRPPTWEAPAPPTEQRPESHPQRVRVLSQNVWNSFFAGGPNRRERLLALGEYLARPGMEADVVAVQEMFTFGLGPLCDKVEADEASQMMGALGFAHQTSPTATIPWLGQSSGLVVYSKLPILREEYGVFSERRSVTAKGWQEVELALAQGSLLLMNTHLEHSHQPSWRTVRESQWKQLIGRAANLVTRELAANFGPEQPGPLVAVLGDFNICGREFGKAIDGGSENQALSMGMHAAGLTHELLRPQDSNFHVPATLRMQETGMAYSPDHFYVTPALHNRLVKASIVDTKGKDGLAVSDHRGVFAEFIA